MSILFFVLILQGCNKGNKGDENSNLDPINDKSTAEYCVKQIADGVMNKLLGDLDYGTYTNEKINGISGDATVSGDKYYNSNISCGSDCVRSETDIDLAIIFNNYVVMSCDNCRSEITGTVYYKDNTWTQQSGLNYSSGGVISCQGNNISYKITSDGWGYEDNITFSASGKSIYSLSGWCTAKNGETYNF